jgi:transposase
MPKQKYAVRLTPEEKTQLLEILNKGKHPAQKVKRANILLELDYMARCNLRRKYKPTLNGIAGRCGVSAQTVYKIGKQYNEEGLEATLTRKKRETPPCRPIITGEIEAKIIALTCSEPPEGHSRWTLRLLEKKVVELGITPHISDSTIHRMLKKHH